MSRNPSMSEEDWRWFELWRGADALSEAEVEALEQQLRDDPLNMDARVRLFGYFSRYEGNKLKRNDADRKLYEIVLWFIENKPATTGFLGTRLMGSGRSLKPKTFGALRQAWLEQVEEFSMDGTFWVMPECSLGGTTSRQVRHSLSERTNCSRRKTGWDSLLA
ncbi:hypothetical protein KF728_04295 [Candidatus Obscuribacterales bacterium]|nr:hypothetical protein [Candidatus Obscuribacterales bacterium]